MTTIGLTIGTTDYSDYVFSADMWRDTLAGIGRWEVLMDPLANSWSQDPALAPDTGVTITLDASTMMMGYIDDVEPYLEGVDADLWKLSGRDYGLDLAELFYTAPKGDYVNLRADDIINRAFTAVGTEITPPAAPFTAPFIDYEWKPRTFLGDAVRDICDMVDYDFYVQDNAARTLHFFAVGAAAEHTGVNLELIPNSLTNNILVFEMGERLGSKIKNYIFLSAGNLRDHWTDLNATGVAATGWFPRAGCIVADNTGVLTEGKSSTQVTTTTNANIIGAQLDFTTGLYSQGGSIDLSEPCMGRYAFLTNYSGAVTYKVWMVLEDINSTQIAFYRTITALLSRNSDATQTGFATEWQIVDKIPFGEQNPERLALGPPVVFIPSSKGYWWYLWRLPPPKFDWTQVTRIHFTSYDLRNAGDYFLVDSLMIPSVEVISIADAGVAANIRMDEDYRPDIRNQVELDLASAAMLQKYENPLEKLRVVATGQVVSDYAGQSLDVQANQFGLVAPTRYRIANLHHMVRRSSAESDVPGWDFLTEYELVRNTRYAGGTQYYSSQRVLESIAARDARLNKLRLQQRARQGEGSKLK